MTSLFPYITKRIFYWFVLIMCVGSYITYKFHCKRVKEKWGDTGLIIQGRVGQSLLIGLSTLSYMTCSIFISELYSSSLPPLQPHWPLCFPSKPSSSCPTQILCSCCFSAWNTHLLHLIELSCFIHSSLKCHLLGKSSATTTLHITLSLIISSSSRYPYLQFYHSIIYLSILYLAHGNMHSMREVGNAISDPSACNMENGIKWALDKYL